MRDGLNFRPFTRPAEAAVLSSQLGRLIGESEAVNRIRDALLPLHQDQMLRIRALRQDKDVPLAVVTASNVLGGMRGIPSLVWDISQVDSIKGITYRGFALERCVASLSKCNGASVPCAEGLLWLLLTGKFPNDEEVAVVRQALLGSPRSLEASMQMLEVVGSIPPSVHPMTQFIVGILAAQSTSRFAADYHTKKMTKDTLWLPILADGLHLLAHLPLLAAFVYRRSYMPETMQAFKQDAEALAEAGLDWVSRMTKLMRLDHPEAANVLRLYTLLHADHEGGNVSAHLAHVVASAHSDIFYAYGAALCGLAGPLHGLACQDSLMWQMELKAWLEKEKGFDLKKINERHDEISASVREYAENEFESGRVIPGFGHAVLRCTDPRYTLLRQWADAHASKSKWIQLNKICCDEISGVLAKKAKVSSPHPNIDLGSGVVLREIGITETPFYTVLFGCARAIGITASTVWSRLLKLPIERPKSVTLSTLEEMVRKAKKAESSRASHQSEARDDSRSDSSRASSSHSQFQH